MLGRFIVPADAGDRIARRDRTGPLVGHRRTPDALDRRRSAAARAARGSKRWRFRCQQRRRASDVAAVVAGTAVSDRRGGVGRHSRVTRAPAHAVVERAALAAAMPALAQTRLGAKIRCGGLTADAFPSVDDVAAFIAAAAAANVPFKATAGLHHPVRHVDRATGFTMHGFLNLLAAAALARASTCETLRANRCGRRPQRICVRRRIVSVGATNASASPGSRRMRRDGFVAYGSCSFAEPVDDLTSLGILPRAMIALRDTTDPRLESWVPVAPESDFPDSEPAVRRLRSTSGRARIGIAIGDRDSRSRRGCRGRASPTIVCERELLTGAAAQSAACGGARRVWSALRARRLGAAAPRRRRRACAEPGPSTSSSRAMASRCACRWRSATTSTSTRRSSTRRISAASSGPMPSRCCRTGAGFRSAITAARARS